MTPPFREDTLKLPDGRVLGYGLYGSPAGLPVLDFHGIPGSRREAALLAAYLDREDVCFIGADRPGFGRSSPLPGRSIGVFSADMGALLDHLSIPRAAALGYSGGGPFALACALRLPGRVAALGLVSCVGPAQTGAAGMHNSNRRKFNLARSLPWLARLMLTAAFSAMRRDPARMRRQLRQVWDQMPAPDRDVINRDSAFAQAMLEITRDAVLNGVSGWVGEEMLMTRPWGFDPAQLCGLPVHLWHGEQDRNVPAAMGRALAGSIPGCRAVFLPAEGHLSLLYNHGKDILQTLLQSAFPAA